MHPRTLVLTLTLTLSLALVSLPFAGAADGATVRLEVGTYAGANLRACDVVVPASASVADVLDQAVVDGCISSWSGTEFAPYGRFVDCIDGICAAVLTFWSFYVDGEFGFTGVDQTPVHDGAVYRFEYQQWVVML